MELPGIAKGRRHRALILRGVAAGLANKELAQNLGLSQNAVKWHIQKLFVELGATSRTRAELVAMAFRGGKLS